MADGSPPPRTFALSASAAKRITELAKAEAAGTRLRLTVSGGGCSGFQYGFKLDSEKNADDHIFASGGAEVVVDDVSLDLVSGAELNFVDDLMGAYFEVRNPNATSKCGCGNSFSV